MITMFDSVNVGALPAGAQAYAGYVDGAWPTFSHLPGAPDKLSIAVFSSDDAECLDVESGDAVNAEVPAWYRRQVARGVKCPVVYTSASNVAALNAVMAGAGIPRTSYLLWSAHYTTIHVCGPQSCGYPRADGTQWTSSADGCDESLLNPGFFTSIYNTSQPDPAPPVEEDMIIEPGLSAPPAGLSFPAAGAYTTMGLLADPTLAGSSSTKLRVAFHDVKGGWDVQDVTVGSGSGGKTVLPVPASADGVSVTRLDAVQVTIFPNFA